MIDPREIEILQQALDTLARGFASLPEVPQEDDTAAIAAVLQDVALRMQDNFPYHHPRYALSVPHIFSLDTGGVIL